MVAPVLNNALIEPLPANVSVAAAAPTARYAPAPLTAPSKRNSPLVAVTPPALTSELETTPRPLNDATLWLVSVPPVSVPPVMAITPLFVQSRTTFKTPRFSRSILPTFNTPLLTVRVELVIVKYALVCKPVTDKLPPTVVLPASRTVLLALPAVTVRLLDKFIAVLTMSWLIPEPPENDRLPPLTVPPANVRVALPA